MKIKKITILTIVAASLFACDTIDENERYVQLETIEAKRNVLLEEFTGQNCPNCPTAHETAAKLKELYREALITVSIHAGPFAFAEGSKSFPTFKTPEGDTYADAWGITTYPAGVINRTSGDTSYPDWATIVRDEIQKDAELDIELTASLNADKTEISITTELKPLNDIEGSLQLWITESNINAVQQNGGKLDANYNHHHVLRAAVNGQWGEAVTIPSNTVHYIDVRDNWNIDNLSVVAFVYNNTDGVLQAAEHHFSDKGLAQDSIPQGNQNGGIVVVRELTFLCGEDTIPNGSTYTSSKLDEAYTAMGMTRFVPDLDLVGDKDGQVTVTVKSLNETMVEICAFGGCQITLPYAGYVTSVSGDLTAGTELPLDIHYTPTSKPEDGIYRAEALITAYYKGYEEDAVSITLVMTNAKVE